MDPQASQYEVEIRVQDSGQNEEVIQDMKNVVKFLLKKVTEGQNYQQEATGLGYV